MIGKLLGHYRILEEIGAGGMGVVYRARDERLERDVAVKVLPAGTLADEAARHRFKKEALALSRVSHANVAAVHDFDTQEGVDFLVMELVPGTTLDVRLAASGALSEPEAVRLGTQLARGLAAAHEKGVVHRDLKPGNLCLTPDGELKILDFGLARLLDPVKQTDGTGATTEMASTLTASGTDAFAGTVPYMAPEQLRGERADARSDLYAAGAVLYELCTGKRPFPQTHGPLLIDAILNQPPAPPSSQHRHLSPALESIILKALDKDPERRYQSARELRVDLERVASPHPSAVPRRRPVRRRALVVGGLVAALSLLVIVPWILHRLHGGPTRIRALAVLPLANLSGDTAEKYFADGMTAELIANLSKIRALPIVISRTSVLAVDVKRPLPEIARQLKVDAVVEGTVRRSAGRVRVTAELLDGKTERHIWGDSYERDEREVLALQDDLARAIARGIEVELTPQELAHMAKGRPLAPQAHEAYLQGRYYDDQYTNESLHKAITSFERAIALEPAYAQAYAGLAYAYCDISNIFVPALEAMPKAEAAAKKALEIEPDLAEAHGALAYVRAFYDWKWTDAGRDFERALDLQPGDARLHQDHARYLTAIRRFSDATAEYGRAAELDPLSHITRVMAPWPFYYARQYDPLIAVNREFLEVDSLDAGAHWCLGMAYVQKGEVAKGLSFLERASRLDSTAAWIQATLGCAHVLAGNRATALTILSRFTRPVGAIQITPYWLAVLYAGLGDKDRAFETLEKAVGARDEGLISIESEPWFDGLRSDPRFRAIVRMVGFFDT